MQAKGTGFRLVAPLRESNNQHPKLHMKGTQTGEERTGRRKNTSPGWAETSQEQVGRVSLVSRAQKKKKVQFEKQVGGVNPLRENGLGP